ncbi:TadE/TadG family type IV pilus assembly protein [Roseivivax sediminis]|uniref:Flp pilus assembly protein TadG n=1 Tax=Roseivivax sediminis TaxID=936889 RepID=A0A1I1SGD5_9RHOB|nr:hypothetical protein [Roseivivax sediminis]SFD45539.1 hypothetical protein SAMN04515678_101155 [Roseivivax sediminis]
MFDAIKSRAHRFLGQEDGDATVEGLLLIPVVATLFAAGWVWHDFGRQTALEQRINYTVGDMMSRETDPIDDAYIDHTFELVLAMLKSNLDKTDLRISVVRQTKKIDRQDPEYRVVWSETRGDRAVLSGTLTDWDDRLPLMARNDQVIVVETWTDHQPVFTIAGLGASEITSYSFTRPRFAPQVLFDDGGGGSHANNGWGNGDQDAPGNSLCNNNAENYDEGQNSNKCRDNVDGSENIEPSGV